MICAAIASHAPSMGIKIDRPPVSEKAERLTAARISAGFKKRSHATTKFGWVYQSYAAHETGQNDFNAEQAAEYGEAFGVSTHHLLYGGGEQDGNASVFPLAGLISAGGSVETNTEQFTAGEMPHVFLFIDVPDGKDAYRVVGESMYPKFTHDTVLICRAPTKEIRSFVGKEVVVCLDDGNRYVKKLERANRSGLYDLFSHNAPPIRNVRVEWVAKIAAIIPEDEWEMYDRSVAMPVVE